MAQVELVIGDITDQPVDALVTAANTGLRGGGGVDGAVHAAAGPRLLEECRALGGCETGDAVVTGPGELPMRHVIHAVGPIWHGGESGEDAALVRAYTRSIDLAREHGCRSLALPAISCGVFGFPPGRAATLVSIVLRAAAPLSDLDLLRMVLFDRATHGIFDFAYQASGLSGPGVRARQSDPYRD